MKVTELLIIVEEFEVIPKGLEKGLGEQEIQGKFETVLTTVLF